MSAFAPRIVATAGHIDHGKSTLVEALTGTDPDRLPEEKRRGMTIELGFAHLLVPDPQATAGGWHAGIVDVPGHADFVRNMVAGVGSVDAALLIVAADDGWMPQTEEHFQILLHLGIANGVVALTKSDLLTERPGMIAGLRAQLAGTQWDNAPIVPVCALGGEGLDELRVALADVLRCTPSPANIGKPRLHVDRVFSPRGVGTVVTGTLSGGLLRTGEEVFIQPAGECARIRGLQNHNRAVDVVSPGMRTAIQLGGVGIACDGAGTGVWRGHTIAGGEAGNGGASRIIHVHLQRLERSDEAPPVKHGQRVWLHHGTASHAARLYLAGVRELAAGASAIGELRFAAPVFVFAGDRFVLRDFSRRDTLAGGTVLEPYARARAWKREPELRSLLTRAARMDAGAWVHDLLERDQFVHTAGLFLASRFSTEEVEAALHQLPNATPCGEWIVSTARWHAALASAAEKIVEHHEASPAEPGLKLTELRVAIESPLPHLNLFEPLLDALTKCGFVRSGGVMRSSGFVPELPAAVRAACDRLRAALTTDRFSPPKLAVGSQSAEDKEALQAMIRSGEVFMLDSETPMLTTAWHELKARLMAHLRSKGRDTVAGLRDAIGGTRRILVPVCERLDRERVTIRHGDWRSLSPALQSQPGVRP